MLKFYRPKGTVCDTCKRQRTRGASRAVRLADVYSITEEEYAEMLSAQDGRCAICGGIRPGNLDIDHDHSVVKQGGTIRESIRGLLCKRCNRRLLPAALDDIRILAAAIAYLSNPPAKHVLRKDTDG